MPKSVLIISANPDLRSQWLRFFGRRGWQVDTASSIADGIACLGSVVADLVLLDLDFDDACGLIFLRAFKQDWRWKSVPVVLVGEAIDPHGLQAARKLGASRFVDSIPEHEGTEAALGMAIKSTRRNVRITEQASSRSEGILLKLFIPIFNESNRQRYQAADP